MTSDSETRPRPATHRGGARRGAGLVGRLVVVAVVLAVGSVAAWLLTRASTPEAGPTASRIPALQVKPAHVQPGSAAPQAAPAADVHRAQPSPQRRHAHAGSLAEWARQVAAVTGIPQRAVLAYGNAELVMRRAEPGCRLSWATLAGIGRVESDHGRFAGARILRNGDVSQPIIGVPLDGSRGNTTIADTDGGTLDGDRVHDRAVGPMQFIPSTWRRYAADGNGDNRADPENIDDAAVAAARYLCAGGRDMGTAAGWWAGLFSYNHSVRYGQQVFGLADTYAREAARALG